MKNFCLLIVTNRENFLKNIFNFYQNCNFKIVIAHNIKSEINYIPNKNIQLIYINENMAFKRISKAIKHIKRDILCFLVMMILFQILSKNLLAFWKVIINFQTHMNSALNENN